MVRMESNEMEIMYLCGNTTTDVTRSCITALPLTNKIYFLWQLKTFVLRKAQRQIQ